MLMTRNSTIQFDTANSTIVPFEIEVSLRKHVPFFPRPHLANRIGADHSGSNASLKGDLAIGMAQQLIHTSA